MANTKFSFPEYLSINGSSYKMLLLLLHESILEAGTKHSFDRLVQSIYFILQFIQFVLYNITPSVIAMGSIIAKRLGVKLHVVLRQ